MERYVQSEKSDFDPRTESPGPGVETGVEEPMSQLELGGGGGGSSGEDVGGGESSYPERPGEADCIYYLKTGFCGYGARCRFNHPRDVVSGGGVPTGRRDFPERFGQPVCQYYMRTGACKFGSSCKYHHPRQGISSPNAVALNIYGYPVRPGEKECSYYMKTGRCKFGMTCKFDHPILENVHQVPIAAASEAGTVVPPPSALATPMIYHNFQSPVVAPTQQYGVIGGNWQVARPPPIVPGSYVQGPYGPMLLPTGAVPVGGWTPYPAPSSNIAAPTTQTSVGVSQLYAVPPPFTMSPPYATGPYPPPFATSTGPSSVQKEQPYPERPGQPECQHYLRTGECKFGPSCRYHHPAEISAQKTRSADATVDLPIRPDAPTCTHFMQHGICKLGASCRFNHPLGSLSYSPSASSLSDIPVAPYPVGSTVPDLAPLSSSLDLQNKDFSVNITSSPNTQITASALPKSGSDPSSSPQSSSQAD